MLQYDEDENITGVIVTAAGAGNPVVQNDLINAVTAVFGISASNVEVFEKKTDGHVKEERENER